MSPCDSDRPPPVCAGVVVLGATLTAGPVVRGVTCAIWIVAPGAVPSAAAAPPPGEAATTCDHTADTVAAIEEPADVTASAAPLGTRSESTKNGDAAATATAVTVTAISFLRARMLQGTTAHPWA